jgi:putative transcriptional regulator
MISNSIAVWRAKAKLTQEELAHRVGVTRQTIICLEKNKYNPSLALAFRAAKVLGCTIVELFEYAEEA